MTETEDPPRLRTLKGELPRELLLALEETPAENATPAELAGLAQRVTLALRETEGKPWRARQWPRVPAARGRVAAVAFSFALGAAAGVLGSSAVFVVISGSSTEPPLASALSKSQKARLLPPAALPPQGSLAPEPAHGSAPDLPNPLTREAARPARSPSSEPATDSSSRPAGGPRDELSLLARAHAALANNPGTALALASDHERNFPDGALVQEREVVAIDALLRLGRRAEASGRAARFHQQFPTSVHGRRIDVLLGNGDGIAGAPGAF